MIEGFDSVRIINLVDRTDRRREVLTQLRRVGAADDPRVSFFPAQRPADRGGFPSVGARGCFESHLAILRQALDDGVDRLLVIEDDFDFAPDIATRGPAIMAALGSRPWGIFYGAPVLDRPVDKDASNASGLVALPAAQAIQTTSCVAFTRAAMLLIEPFLTAMLGRPPGSPDYGPMHVDGAYSVFRRLHPDVPTLICDPPIGLQRSSRSDITPNRSVLDRIVLTRPLATALRRARNWTRGRNAS